MTLGDAKRKVYELLDEYGLGSGVDSELELKMADFLDMAQKELAARRPIVRRLACTIEEGQRELALPTDFRTLIAVRKNGEQRTLRFRLSGTVLLVPAGMRGEIELEYTALPATLTAATPDETALEIAEDAQQAMPFFAAAMVLSSDLVNDANIFLAMYQMMVNSLPDEPSSAPVRVRCTLFRG